MGTERALNGLPEERADSSQGEAMILRFPQVGVPAESGATWCQRIMSRAIEVCGVIAGKLGLPGAVRDAVIEDEATGQHVQVRVGRLFTRISVDGRDYYFNRFTGRFDGTGSGCR
jgi:hypothetical protein